MRRGSRGPPIAVVSRSDLYAVEAGSSHRRPPRLPVHVDPQPGEALCSWLVRLGRRLALTPPETASCAFGMDTYHRPEWWRRPSAPELAAIANKSGLAIERIRAMTLTEWVEARRDERHGRIGAPGFLHQRARAAASQPVAMCGRCLASDSRPFIRVEWMIGWVSVCAKHGTVLATHCPHCGAVLTMPGINRHQRFEIGRCTRCENLLDEANAEPALDAIRQLQECMLGMKLNGTGHLPGIGFIAWETLIGLIDLVLIALWRPRAQYTREQLFARIVRDSGLDPEQRFRIDWSSNYGTMRILVWLFESWPSRMAEAVDLLRAPPLHELLAMIAEMGDTRDERLETMLTGIVPDRPPIEDERRRWLESLPETGEILRQLSQREKRQGMSERLWWLAQLRDGANVETVAERSGLRTATIERWLDVGLEYGLEKLTDNPLRLNLLAPQLRQAITGWLASTNRLSTGYNNWSPLQGQQEIAARFGVMLSTACVVHLFREAPQ